MKLPIIPIMLLFAAVAQGQQPESVPVAPKPRISQYVETARPAEEIQQTYPYDIPLRNAGGDTLNSSGVFEKNGKPTVLLFWLTTCAPCRQELTAIASKYDRWKHEADFNFYAVSIDFPHNFEAFVNRVGESRWPFPAYYDLDREFGQIMPGRLNGLPQTFLLDKDGNIVHHKRKYAPGDEDALFDLLKTLQ